MELEQSLLNKSDNVEALTSAFFPPNQPLPLVVEVCYYVFPNRVPDEVVSPDNQADCGNFTYKFRWTKSQVHFFINPLLLQSLSLYVIQTREHTVQLALDKLCDTNQTLDDRSTGQYIVYSQPELLLEILTTSVSSTCTRSLYMFSYKIQPFRKN